MGILGKLFGKKDINPNGKKLNWFTSADGLESLKIYTSTQSYMLEERLKEEYEKKSSNCSFGTFLNVYHKDAQVPSLYFKALVQTIKVQPLEYVGPNEMLIFDLKTMAQPYEIGADGNPIAHNTILPLEQIVSVEKNPVLNFVKNFKVFYLINDSVGTFDDKYNLYSLVLTFLPTIADRFEIEKNQWLFDKNTYIDDFGLVRKEKDFLLKCKELSNFPHIFDSLISKLE